MKTSFKEFWRLYAPLKEFKNRYKACEKLWEAMDDRAREWIARGLEKEQAESPPPIHRKNPYFYLTDWEPPQPQWLAPNEVGRLLAQHIPLAVCLNAEKGIYGTVTKEEAALYELKVHHYM